MKIPWPHVLDFDLKCMSVPKTQNKYIYLSVKSRYLSQAYSNQLIYLYIKNDNNKWMSTRQFAMSGGSEEPLRALACRVLLEGSSTEVLQEVLSVYPEEAACTPEDVMLQALRIILNFWKNQNIEVRMVYVGCWRDVFKWRWEGNWHFMW